jgi:hypothetical protein
MTGASRTAKRESTAYENEEDVGWGNITMPPRKNLDISMMLYVYIPEPVNAQ